MNQFQRRFLFALLIVGQLQAQKIDSLESVLETAKGDQKVKTLNELFRAHSNSDPVTAIGFAREALSLATEIDDQKGMAAAYNNLGVAYRTQGALDKALEYYLTSLRIYITLDNKEGIATTKNNIGTIYSLEKDYGQAMKYFEEAHELFSQLDDQTRILGTMNNLGNLYSDLQLYEQALKYYSQAYQLSEKMGKPYSDPLSNIGNLYFRQGNLQRAVEYYQRALDMANKNNNRMNILNITSNLARVYTQAGQSATAQHYIDDAMALSKSLKALIFEPDLLRTQAENYYKQGKTAEAYQALLKYDAAREKIHSDESTRKIAQMEMALEMSEKVKEIEQLKKDDEIKTLQLKNTRMVVTIVVLGIVAIVAFVNLFVTRRKAKKYTAS